MMISAALLPASACGVESLDVLASGSSVAGGASRPSSDTRSSPDPHGGPELAGSVPATPAAAGVRTAASALSGLVVKGRAPKTGYGREQFGRRWADIDRDGCDQRNQVLARDMSEETFKPGTHDCVVLTGTLHDPYTARTIAFTRGASSSADVQIDHVVALSDAWQKGAGRLDAPTRERIGNDPLNLVAVDGPTNARKGDGDAATWLPPSTRYRCAYVARQVAVKDRYRLSVTPAERDAITRILNTCPGQQLPTDSSVPANSFR